MIRAALFDFDGTLADSFAAITASTNHVRESYGLPPLPESGEMPSLRDFRDRAEREYICMTLKSCEWNISRAAALLGVERTNLHKKMRALGIHRAD